MARFKNSSKRSPFHAKNTPQINEELGQTSSSTNTEISESSREESFKNRVSENADNQQTSSTKIKKSKRKGSLPKRRRTLTEVYQSNYNYTINRFGLREKCSRNQALELRYYQKSTHLLIPRLPFSRLIREILMQHLNTLRIQVPALLALQEAAEIYLVDMFGVCNLLAAHAKRVTVNNKDMILALMLQNPQTGNPNYLRR